MRIARAALGALSLPALAAACLATGCSSEGSSLVHSVVDAAPDATLSDDAGVSPGDDGAGSDDGGLTAPQCMPTLPEGGSAPSDDCVGIGRCPQDCLSGAASAFACAAPDPTVGTYPSVFVARGDPMFLIGYVPSAYPWEAGAFVTCGAQACVRWATADHVEGGSAWASDPCAGGDGGASAPLAWACPEYQGFTPPVAGCFNAGIGQEIGGADTGAARSAVWCCPPAPDGGDDGGEGDGATPDGTAGDGAAAEGGTSGDDASDDATGDASAGGDAGPSADGGPEASTD
jgi:hypothetical protein